MDKPTDLRKLRGTLQTYYQQAHAQMRDDDDFYYQREGVVRMRKPRNIPIHMPSTATNIVDNMRDQIRTDQPVVDFAPRSRGEQADRLKSHMEKWGQDRLFDCRTRYEVDIIDQWKHDLLLRGAAAGKVLVNPELPDRPSDPEELKQWKADTSLYDPFVVHPIDPLSVFPAPGPKRPLTYVLEVQYRTVADVLDSYPQFKDPTGHELRMNDMADMADDLTREVEWLEYWDKEHYIVEVDGQRIIDEENPYGVVPYIFEYSGLGREHANGNPVNLARGILTAIHGELQAEVRIKTAWDAQWQFHVFPVLLVKSNAKLAERMLSVGPGSIAEWGNLGNEKPEWLRAEAPNPTMSDFLGIVMSNISRQSAPVLSNPGAGSGSEFGILEALRIGQALKVISPVVKALNKMGTQLLNLMARLAFTQGLSFEVTTSEDRVTSLDGSKFTHYTFDVDFESVDAAENDRRMLIGQGLVGAGLISRRTFHQRFGRTVVDDPDAEEEQLMVEALTQQALQSGMLLQAVMQQQAMEQERARTAQTGAQVMSSTLGGISPEIATEALGGLAPGAASRTAGRNQISESELAT